MHRGVAVQVGKARDLSNVVDRTRLAARSTQRANVGYYTRVPEEGLRRGSGVPHQIADNLAGIIDGTYPPMRYAAQPGCHPVGIVETGTVANGTGIHSR